MPVIGFVSKKSPQPFILEVTTTLTPNVFYLSTPDTGSYDYHVDWGDGQSNDITTYNDTNKNHWYATPGSYDITISGTFNGWKLSPNANANLITNIKQWGIFNPGNNVGAFKGCSNMIITATDNIDLTGVTSLDQFFYQCTNLTSVPEINNWDVSGIENMTYLFSQCPNFNQNIGGWDVSSVTNMFSIFEGCSIFNQDISSWDVSKVTIFQSMFLSNSLFNQDISGWDVSSATSFFNMFFNADSFNQDIGGWDTTNVTTFRSMFYLNNSVFDQDISEWNVENVTSMQNMFSSSGMSTANYNALLIAWEGQSVQDNVILDAGSSTYNAGAAATARQALIDDHSWTINDSGQV